MRPYIITKVDPMDEHELLKTYNKLMVECIYDDGTQLDLTFNDFLKCRDSIFTTVVSHIDTRSYPNAIIGCRRVYAGDYLSDLPYHCQDNDTIYIIDFLHMENNIDRDEFTRIPRLNVFTDLVETCLADKNDSFCIILKDLCPEISEFDSINLFEAFLLNQAGFELKHDNIKNVDYFIRSPRVDSGSYKK